MGKDTTAFLLNTLKIFLHSLQIQLILIVFLLGFCPAIVAQTENTFERFEPIKFKDNISLKGFEVLETYKLSEEHLILIARPEEHDPKNEGLRILHLKFNGERFKVTFVSYGAGESFIYQPTFFRKDDKTVIVCEMGTEYSWGMDAFLLYEGTFTRLGNMNVAARYGNEEHQEPAVPFLNIMEEENALLFSFKNRIRLYFNPGQEDEKTIQPTTLSYRYHFSNGWEMERK